MAFHVPICVHILWVILLIATDLNLFETPLRQDGIRRSKITSKNLVTESHTSSEGMDAINFVALLDIVNDLDGPVIVVIADSGVTVARDFMVEFGDGRRNLVGVQVTCGSGMIQADDVAMLKESEWTMEIVRWFIPTR